MEYQISLSLAAAIIIWLILALVAFILGICAGMILSMFIFNYILKEVGLEGAFIGALENNQAEQERKIDDIWGGAH